MPDLSNIDTEKILSVVNQLDSCVERMDGCVGRFADAIETLDKGWVSEVKAGFMSTYQADWEAMQEMLFQLREVSTTLQTVASDFEKTENEALSGASSLR